jgi:hypothetical protein
VYVFPQHFHILSCHDNARTPAQLVYWASKSLLLGRPAQVAVYGPFCDRYSAQGQATGTSAFKRLSVPWGMRGSVGIVVRAQSPMVFGVGLGLSASAILLRQGAELKGCFKFGCFSFTFLNLFLPRCSEEEVIWLKYLRTMVLHTNPRPISSFELP